MSEQVIEKWNNQIPWQKDSNYIIRCIEETFSESRSSGSPMITLEFEVAAPETMKVGDHEYMIAGVKAGLKSYYPTISLTPDGEVDAVKTANAQERVKILFRAFDLDDTSIDFKNPALAFKGKTVYALLDNEETAQRKSPTKDQLSKGQKQGDILLNPKTKKPLMQNYPKVREIFGTASVESGAAY